MQEFIQKRRTTAYFAFLLTIVVVLAWFSFWSARLYVEDSAWESQTYQVLEAITAMDASLRTAESQVRGFVIRGQEEYLGDFDQITADLRRSVDRLSELTKDNVTEEARVSSIRGLVEERIGIMQNAIQRREKLGLAAVANNRQPPRGLMVTDEITRILFQMKANEQGLLGSRRSQANVAARQAEIVTSILGALIALVLSTGFIRLRRDSTERLLAQGRLAAQYRFATILAETETLNKAFQPILATICRSFETELGELWLLDRSSGTLHPVSVYSPEAVPEVRLQQLSVRSGAGLPGNVLANKHPVYVRDSQTEPEVLQSCVYSSRGLRSAAGFPIASEGEVIGVLTFFSKEVRDFGPEVTEMMTGFCRQLGQYIERKHTEQQLSEERMFQQMTLASIGDGVITTNIRGDVTFMNFVAEKLTGWTLEEAKGLNFGDIVQFASEQSEVVIADPVRTVLKSATPCEMEEKLLLTTHDGNRIPTGFSASPILTETDAIIGVVLVIRDVSARRALERMKDEFISVVSHELRTPLTSIRGSLGLLEGGIASGLSPRAKRMLGIAVTNTDRLVRLINDILDIERMESGKISLQRKDQNLGDLMQQAVDLMQGMASQSQVQLQCRPLSIQVTADRDRMLQIISNLLGNAIKFSGAGKEVLLSAEAETDRVLIKVADQGRGIPADQMENIFGRFQQVDTSDSRDKGGTGLGLAISRTLARQHGGDIWVESELGRGSIFYVALPLPVTRAEPLLAEAALRAAD